MEFAASDADSIESVEALWAKVRDALPKARREEVSRLRKLLESTTSEAGKVLVTQPNAKSKLEFSPKSFKQTLLASTIPLSEIPNLNQIATEIVRVGNRHGFWALPLPFYCKYIEPERNPFQPGFGETLSRVRRWRAAMVEMFVMWPRFNEPQRLGVYLLNAVIRGGHMSQPALAALYRQILLPINILSKPGHAAFIDLELDWYQQSGTERRRWELDPLSELMLVGLKHPEGFDPNQKINAATLFGPIHAAFKGVNFDKDDIPHSLSELLESTTLLRYTQMPAILCAHATREFPSNALKPHVQARLAGLRPGRQGGRVPVLHDYDVALGQLRAEVAEPIRSGLLADNVTVPTKLIDAREYLEPWQKSLREIWSSSHKKRTSQEAISALKGLRNQYVHPQDQSSLQAALMDWTLFMAHSEASQKSFRTASRPSTILHHLSAIDSRLYGIDGNKNLSVMEAHEFDVLYELCLEEKLSAKYRQSLSLSIRKFHEWLKYDGRTTVSLEEISALGGGVEVRQVDANLFSEKEFQAILNSLSRQMLHLKHRDLPEVAALVTILAYRCGFRRSEIYKIQLSDVVGIEDEWIYVDYHTERSLKSENSVRKIPVRDLLYSDEYRRFVKWVNKRRNMVEPTQLGPSKIRYLFAVEGGSEHLPSVLQVFNAIHRAMREATGDLTPHFHLLRHSAGTTLTLQLICADSGIELDARFGSGDTKTDLERARTLRRKLLYPFVPDYIHESGFDGPTRKIPYLVSHLLGHSHPTVGLEHYVHCLDILFNNARRVEDADFECSIPISARVAVSPLNAKTTYKILKPKGQQLQQLIERVRKKLSTRYFTVESESAEAGNSSKTSHTESGEDDEDDLRNKRVSLYGSLLTLWEAISRVDIQDIPSAEVALKCGIEQADLDSAVEVARHLKQLRGSGKQHWMHEVQEPKHYISICPQLPRKKSEIQTAKTIAAGIEVMRPEFQVDFEALCDHVVYDAQRTHNYLLLRGIDEAAPILRVVNEISGVYPIVSIYMTEDLSDKTRKTLRQQWNQLLQIKGLGPYPMRVADGDHKIRRKGVIRVELSPERASTASSAEGRLGFRWVLLMLWIQQNAMIFRSDSDQWKCTFEDRAFD